jgi:cullin 1
LNTGFKEFEGKLLESGDEKPVDASYAILGTGFWPLNPPNTDFTPPAEIAKAYERFQTFYGQKHSGRKLTWLWQLCKGEVKANYCKNTKVPYTFQVSTYQMAILLLFNESDKNSYDDIVKATQLQADVLDPALGIFVKAKVLNMTTIEGGKGDADKPGPDKMFSLNYDFKSKKIRVNLNIAVKSEQKQEVDDTHKTIEEDRKLLMQVSYYEPRILITLLTL